ncbi:hypothetical protein DJ021_16575 [Phenylobacterium hankyongense]|uniref:Resolvase HTH domain-containing protein n=1 Tax=Phenylobacterium hankyongense TaxID=1813876 RepID=A0A328B1L1_9CAUL|nr:hypothetical protein DJ021_16575 [Phenylobacterium hankyongense]
MFETGDAAPDRRILLAADGAQDSGHDLEEMDALTLDALLVVLDLLARSPDGAVVNARTVLEAKNYRRCGRERQAFERKILEHLRRLARLNLELAGGVQPFFDFAPRNVARTDFIVRPGTALATGLALETTTELPRSVLHIDHRRNRRAEPLAKKLAVLFALSGPIPNASIAALLVRVGEPIGAGGEPRQGRVVLRFDAAIALLVTLGQLEIRNAPAITRRKGWIQRWLSSQVAIEPSGAAFAASGGARHPTLLNGETLHSPRPTIAPEWAPFEPSRGRGRPRFTPSEQQRQLVETMYGRGRTRETIADTIGVSLPTLRRYFAAELARSPSEPLRLSCDEHPVIRRRGNSFSSDD